MTLSEAQDDCDMFFSTSIMDDVDGVYLLHGHGTGVLKAGIRRVRLCSNLEVGRAWRATHAFKMDGRRAGSMP